MSDFQLFKLKYFQVYQSSEVFKIGTDAFVLGSWIQPNFSPNRILDLGTGTGILSLMMAQKFPDAQITSIDSSKAAVDLANLNFTSNEAGVNCFAVQASFETFSAEANFDLIVSNPPFFVNALSSKAEVNAQAKHLNDHALSGLFATIKRLLSPIGIAVLIHPPERIFEESADNQGLFVKKRLNVYGVQHSLVRVCNVYNATPSELQSENLIIRDETGKYTEAYKRLTSDYHGVDL